ncbi:MAG: class I SAM-dependent methyltransferase [Acidobacteria bacterium]|nr:class I SAM-dependent methyltransferase [Acidobacteriota bacterium]
MNDGPNALFIQTWNDILTPKWLEFRHVFAANSMANQKAVEQYLTVRPGERVLDIGCSFGESCVWLADAVGPEGTVVGLDCNQSFIDIARKETEGRPEISYLCGDGQTLDLGEERFDLCFSRFGVMFFAQHILAFRNFHKAMKPGGRVFFIVWRGQSENVCFDQCKKIALNYLPQPGDDAQTCGPGPFFLFDKERNRHFLEAAGFTDVVHHPIDILAPMGRNMDEAVRFQMQIGPMGEIIREAGALGLQKLPEIEREVRAFLSGYETPEGISLPTASWAIQATKP